MKITLDLTPSQASLLSTLQVWQPCPNEYALTSSKRAKLHEDDDATVGDLKIHIRNMSLLKEMYSLIALLHVTIAEASK